jgi:hypothetical protein
MRMRPVFERSFPGYVAWVDGLPGANTQGATLAETRANLGEAVLLVLETNRMIGAMAAAGLWPTARTPGSEPNPSAVDLLPDLPFLPAALDLCRGHYISFP